MKQYRLAAHSYTFIIDHAAKGKRIRFLYGEWSSLLANAYMQRSQAAHAQGHLDQALADLKQAIHLINQWIRRHALQGVKEKHAAGEGRVFPLLPLTETAAATPLHQPDGITKTWLELYVLVPWQYAEVLLWHYKVDPAMFDLNLWHDAQEIVEMAAQNCERFASLSSYAPGLYCLAAEIALTFCEKVPLNEWKQKIDAASTSLTLADTFMVLQAATSPSALISQRLLKLMHSCHEYWEALWIFQMTGNNSALRVLDRPVYDHTVQAEKANFHHIEARGYYLLGQINEHLEAVPITALKHYRQAEKIFNDEAGQFFPRIAETRRAIDRILVKHPQLT